MDVLFFRSLARDAYAASRRPRFGLGLAAPSSNWSGRPSWHRTSFQARARMRTHRPTLVGTAPAPPCYLA